MLVVVVVLHCHWTAVTRSIYYTLSTMVRMGRLSLLPASQLHTLELTEVCDTNMQILTPTFNNTGNLNTVGRSEGETEISVRETFICLRTGSSLHLDMELWAPQLGGFLCWL